MMKADTLAEIRHGVRRLVPLDIDQVIAIDQASIGQQRRGFFQNRLEASLDEPAAFVSLGYVEAGQLKGFMLAHMLDGEFGGRYPICVMDAVGVDTSVRGHGGAHALMKELQAAARGRGAHAVRTQMSWPSESLTHFFGSAGFKLGTRLVLGRSCARLQGEKRAADVLGEGADLSEEDIEVCALTPADLPAIVRIDRDITGQDRSAYLHRKANEALRRNGVRMSMVAKIDGTPAGFIMARVDYGEFGRVETEAVLDTIGIDREFSGRKVGMTLVSQLLDQLGGLQVDHVRTIVEWNNAELLAFLDRMSFRPTQNLALTLAL